MVNLTGVTKLTETIPEITLSNFSILEYYQAIQPLLFFVLGVTVYSIFIFKFYRFLSRRDIIKFKLEAQGGFIGWLKKLGKSIIYLIENIVLTPVVIFFSFAVLTTFLLILTKSGSIESVILTSMALIAAVRVTAYYNESLSQDLAKMVPFALLGIFLIDINYFSVGDAMAIVRQIPSIWMQLIYYLIFVIALEIALRILQTIIRIIMPLKEEN